MNKYCFKRIGLKLGILAIALLSVYCTRKIEISDRKKINGDSIFDDSDNYNYAGPIKVKFSNVIEKTEILPDDMPKDQVLDFKFNTMQLLTFEIDNEKKEFSFTNVAPVTFRDLFIFASLSDGNKICILHLDSITSFIKIKDKIDFIDKIYLTANNEEFEIKIDSDLDKAVYTMFTNDSIYDKLAKIKIDWDVTFSRPGLEYHQVNPLHVKENIVLFTNMAYLYSQPEVKEGFLNYEYFTDNNGDIIPLEKREQLYDKIENFKNFRTAVNDGKRAAGLGVVNGKFLCIAQYMLMRQYIPGANFTTYFHEFGHCLGYHHSSNMTYPADGKGFVEFCYIYYWPMLRRHELPFWDYRYLNTWNKYKDLPEGDYLHDKNYKTPTYPY